MTVTKFPFRILDLTHPLAPGIPIWPDDPAVEIKAWASYDQEGYFVNWIGIGEHSGTHWGTPNTFVEGARSAESYTADELVRPAVVIDVRQKAAADPGCRLILEDIHAWEAVNGPIPAGSVAVLFTGWQDRWRDPAAFFNQDEQGISHWPGFSEEAAAFLMNERGAAGLGTDTHGVDPGDDDTFGASLVAARAGGIILECLAGLDQLPPQGATLVIGGLPVRDGAGSPARILAFLPYLA